METTRENKGIGKPGLIDLAALFAERFAMVLSYLAIALLLLMMLLTCFNVLVRSLPGDFTLVGIYEITGYLASAVVAFAIPYTQLTKGHIAIDWLVARLSGRAQATVNSIALLVSASLFALLAWQSFRFAGDLWLNGEVSPTQKMPFFPFVYGVSLGCFSTALLLTVDFVKSVVKAVRK